MELVYLWVDSYKNIRNQGFNFSPRFECEFDENTKELTINEKKDYMSIFPKNINVTAIVGENGSGKSSLVKNIIEGINPYKVSYDKQRMLACWLNHEKNCIYIHTYINNLNKEKIKSNFEFKIEKNQESFYKYEEGYEKEKFESFFYFYNYNLEKESDILDVYELNKEYIIHGEFNKTDDFINLKEIENKLQKNFLNYMIDTNESINSEIKKFFIPNKIVIEKRLKKILNKSDNKFYLEFKQKNENDYLKLSKLEYLLYLKNEQKFIDFFREDLNINKLLENISFESMDNIFLQLNDKLNLITPLIEEARNNIIENNNLGNDYGASMLNELEKMIDFYFNINKLQEYSSYQNENSYTINNQFINNEMVNFLQNLPSYLSIDFIDENNKYLSDLSSGEQNLLKVIYSIKNIIKIRKETLSFNIFLDEIENTLHPNWQKKLINWLIEAFKNYKTQINIFITSHSPFILSDIPKENVIFLEKYDEKNKKKLEKKYPKLDIKGLENGNCINVSEHIELKTFGANIHTLLSDGFFMSDGLMGEFAKSKINEIKKFYDDNKNLKKDDSDFESKKDDFEKNKKYFENIQKIIGEPFLQTIIKNYLDELEILFNGKKEFLDKEIKRLEELRKEI